MSKAFEMISESLNEIIEDLEKHDGKNLKRKVMTEEKISPLAAGILQGVNETIEDVKGFEVEGMKKTTIYHKQKVSIADVVKYSEEKMSAYRQAANK